MTAGGVTMPYPPFEAGDSGDAGVRWTKYLARYKNMMKGYDITAPDKTTGITTAFWG